MSLKILLLRTKGLQAAALIVLLLAIAALAEIAFVKSSRISDNRGEKVVASIVGFAIIEGEWSPSEVRVTAETSDGITGTAVTKPERLIGCNIGDPIKARRSGIVLRLEPEPCSKLPATPPS